MSPSAALVDLPRPLRFVDLFAGAGGFGLGLRHAGFQHVLSVEADAWAAATLRENHPRDAVLEADIRDFRDAAVIRTQCGGTVDLVIGGPPCQGFSIAGPAKDPNDPRNSLFQEYANWVAALAPYAFILENVKGLLSRRTASGIPVIRIIQDRFRELGYEVTVWRLNAAAYGVPQVRERVFVVGHRLGDFHISSPQTTNRLSCDGTPSEQLGILSADELPAAVSLWDAISDLPSRAPGGGLEDEPYAGDPQTPYQRMMRDGSTRLFNHVAMSHSRRLVERFKHVGWGESSADVPSEHRARRRDGSGLLTEAMYSQNNRRLHPYRPSHTITASFYANFLHPYEHRNLTAREGARIQSFPDSYRFMGKKTVVSQKLLHREERHADKHLCQYAQIGNAVPPLLALRIGNHIAEALVDELRTRIEFEAEGRAQDKVSRRRQPTVPVGDPSPV